MRPDDARLPDLFKGLARIARLRRELAEEEAHNAALLEEVFGPELRAGEPVQEAPPLKGPLKRLMEFMEILRKLQQPFTTADVVEATGKCPRTVNSRLREAKQAGLIQRLSRGRYKVVPGAALPAT